jgi:hypothetical protein
VFTDDGDTYLTVPVVDGEAADAVSRRWECEGFDTQVVTCPDH